MKRDYLIGPDKYKERHGHPFHRRRFHDCRYYCKSQWKTKYEFKFKLFSRMPNCKQRLDWDKGKLMNHFFRRHRSITLRNYYEAYVQRVRELSEQYLFICPAQNIN